MTRDEIETAEAARQLDVKIDVAIEIMAEMIASNSLKIIELRKSNNAMVNTFEEKRKMLLQERRMMYKRDMNIINKIINVYSKELIENQHKSA